MKIWLPVLFLLLFFQKTNAQNCNNWLSVLTQDSKIAIGDLDITGDQLTVEANFNRTMPLNSGLYPGFLVSKHTGSADDNYSLFPNGCAITTTNGFFLAFENCPFVLNKTIHVAMVYDGANLKYYRNGFLINQTPCTGNLINNDIATTIADIAGTHDPNAQFLGYVNEVRIWNVARTQVELQTYMNTSLPSPTTQVGLKGYYIFDDLSNKQGNSTYNGTSIGTTSINTTNPNCSFTADSCTSCNSWLSVLAQDSKVIVGDLDITGNQLTVEANFNRTMPLNGGLYPGFLVSKHTGPADDNYSLFPNGCALTTTNGLFLAFENCPFVLNKTIHVAMVYDGANLKYYRNGFLINQTPCTGNLINNDIATTIADIAGTHDPNAQFLGYINEVRIWNVARSQAELQTYMNTTLPNPTTQVGLKGYYTFDNLLNKQGNATYNGTLIGTTSVNATNPNCSFIADSCTAPGPNCTDWLQVLSQNSKVAIGDLDITGNQLTVEANFNRTAALNSGLYPGFLVSKHTGAADDNYSLFPNGCALTTTNGFFLAFESCPFVLNKTIHVAMVYDGANLKYYRNGFLINQTPCTGNLITNNITATISDFAGPHDNNDQFLGYVNEIRIWNVARTQTQLQTYMNSSLPNPAIQIGLQGYYIFNDLLNKQGNAAYNGTIIGTAAINATNPDCAFIADSCGVIIPLTLLEFSGKLVNNNTSLNWKTNGEINTRSFDIERSIDGRSYTNIGTVDAVDQPGINNYGYTDKNIISLGVPVLYYRLKQIDIDGRFRYSPIVTIHIDNKNAVLFYPNPVTDKINCTVSSNKPQQFQVRLIDNTGRIIQQEIWQLTAGSSAFMMNVGNLAKGMYYLELKGDMINYHKEFIKQ